MAEVLSDERIREIMLANGFTVKEGQTDLKPYVFAAARAIERAVLAQPSGGDAPAEIEARSPTDMSVRLRKTADRHPGWKPLLDAAADEIERYYTGMQAWKSTAEAKDRQFAALAQQQGRDAFAEGSPAQKAFWAGYESCVILDGGNPGNIRLRWNQHLTAIKAAKEN